MRIRLIATSCLLLLVAGGCSSIRHEYDGDAAFAYDTWDWMTLETEDVELLVDRRIRRNVTSTLALAGFRQRTKEPQFLATYYEGRNRPIDPSPLDYRYGRWGKVAERSYPEGSIVLDFVDARTRELVWRGSARDVLDSSRADEKRDKSIDEAVKKLLEKFPPK